MPAVRDHDVVAEGEQQVALCHDQDPLDGVGAAGLALHHLFADQALDVLDAAPRRQFQSELELPVAHVHHDLLPTLGGRQRRRRLSGGGELTHELRRAGGDRAAIFLCRLLLGGALGERLHVDGRGRRCRPPWAGRTSC